VVLVLQLRIISTGAVVRAAGRFLMAPLPAGARDDDMGIGRPLLEDETGQQVLNLRDTQRDVGRARRSPFFRGVCRARIAERKAWA